MCNRYQLQATSDGISRAFSLKDLAPDAPLRGEFFPGKTVPVARQGGDGRELAGAEWGIRLGKHQVTNSRDDKIESTWGRFLDRRVVFPLSRAVEWHYDLDMYGEPTGKPKPWVLYPADESIAAIAGIAGGGGVSMMTCRATGIAAEVHNKHPADPRMIVFLTEPEEVERWLDPDAGEDDVVDLLKSPQDGWLAAEALN